MPNVYTLTPELYDRIAQAGDKRTVIMKAAVDLASSNPTLLADALHKRLTSTPPDDDPPPGLRVTVSFKHDTLNKLRGLTRHSRLGTEHVIRLALESYLIHRERNEPDRHLQRAPEGGHHD